MTEYFTIKRIDNSRLVRPTDATQTQDFWRRVAVGGALAACLLIYAWQHFECIQLRYQIQTLEGTRAKSAQLNEQLHVAVAELHNPARIAKIAEQIGLTVPTPGQVAPSQGASDAVLAQAHVVMQPQRP
jgi:cell division protein FtsL